MNTIKYLFFLLSTVILFGCNTSESIDTTPIKNSIMSMKEFSRNNDLTVVNASGGYLFTKTGVRLHIYPHVKYLRYNGQTIEIPDAPFVADGELFLPLTLIASLPESFRAKKALMSDAFIIIDAGHGGEDTGAISGTVLEKDIALDISRRLQRNLGAAGIASKLTREGDYFITLDERSRIANRHPGAIFISIHVNAETSGSAEGIETYFLSSKISDNQRAEWAATEYDFNTANGALDPQTEIRAARKISKDIRNRSKILAESVQSSLINNIKEEDRGVKQANFSVLRESFFGPAILIETGFISHDFTKKKLIQPEYRQKIADSISAGIINFTSKQ